LRRVFRKGWAGGKSPMHLAKSLSLARALSFDPITHYDGILLTARSTRTGAMRQYLRQLFRTLPASTIINVIKYHVPPPCVHWGAVWG